MNKNTRIAAMLIDLNLIYRDPSIDEPTIKAYVSVLSDFDIATLSQAAKSYAQTGKRFPLPSDLIELCHLKA